MLRAHVLVLSLFFVAGCAREDDVRTYRVSKETPPPNDGSLPQTRPQKEIEWKTPAGWEEQAPSAMRLGSFRVQNASGTVDVSVIPLAGAAGGPLANINRWRGQIGLGALTEQDLPSHSETFKAGGRSMQWVDFENKGRRITAALYVRSDRTWFFKMTGEDAAVLETHPAFRRFLTSLRFHETP
jgi:hypothetical protein